VPLMPLPISYLEIWPDARSTPFPAIHRGSGNTIPAIPPQNGDYLDVCRGASFTRIHSGQW